MPRGSSASVTRALLLRSGCHSQPKGWPRDSKDRWPVKHSLSPRPGRQCDAPATTTWTLRPVRALAAVPWGPPAAVPGPQGHRAFLLDSRKRPSPDTPADTSPLRASAGFVPTSLRRLLHRQLRLIIRHQRPYLCLCCVLSWQKLKFNCRPACLDPLASDAFQLFRPASRRAGT